MIKNYLTWDDIDSLTDNLVEQIKRSPWVDDIHYICGIQRGGLIPAVILSHKLSLPMIQIPNNNTLLVDDICDSGETLRDILKPKFTATLHLKPNDVFTPKFYAESIEDIWQVYPWELNESKTIQDYKL